ncbi:hypothetical protein AB0L65_58290 [Nonomuraea sp. NPDC052116]|uniref:hypothetical protein n=1 Tax=Nonomuraea sp. NPDC052116 TaxID=3155665 RepID=UPI003436AA71
MVLLSSQGVGSRPNGVHPNARGEPIPAHRTAAAPFGDVAPPTIDPDDLAALGLREGGHTGRTYTLTPRERAAASR